MTLTDLFQILKWEYGSIKEIAETISISSETVKNILLGGQDSQYKEQVLYVATKKANQILRGKISEAEAKIAEALEQKERISRLMEYLAEGVNTPTPATANA